MIFFNVEMTSETPDYYVGNQTTSITVKTDILAFFCSFFLPELNGFGVNISIYVTGTLVPQNLQPKKPSVCV